MNVLNFQQPQDLDTRLDELTAMRGFDMQKYGGGEKYEPQKQPAWYAYWQRVKRIRTEWARVPRNLLRECRRQIERLQMRVRETKTAIEAELGRHQVEVDSSTSTILNQEPAHQPIDQPTSFLDMGLRLRSSSEESLTKELELMKGGETGGAQPVIMGYAQVLANRVTEAVGKQLLLDEEEASFSSQPSVVPPLPLRTILQKPFLYVIPYLKQMEATKRAYTNVLIAAMEMEKLMHLVLHDSGHAGGIRLGSELISRAQAAMKVATGRLSKPLSEILKRVRAYVQTLQTEENYAQRVKNELNTFLSHQTPLPYHRLRDNIAQSFFGGSGSSGRKSCSDCRPVAVGNSALCRNPSEIELMHTGKTGLEFPPLWCVKHCAPEETQVRDEKNPEKILPGKFKIQTCTRLLERFGDNKCQQFCRMAATNTMKVGIYFKCQVEF